MIRTAFIEDNPRYRQLLEEILSNSDRTTIVFQSNHCVDIIGELRKCKPDVVLMDINLPGKSGIEGTLDIKRIFSEMKVLVLTVFREDDKIFSAIKAGADGYLLKQATPQKILDSIQEVYEGKASMDGFIARKIFEYFQKKPALHQPDNYNLTPRESEILGLIIEGLSYKEMASRCFISVQTIPSHIKNIYKKLDVHSRAEISARFRNTSS